MRFRQLFYAVMLVLSCKASFAALEEPKLLEVNQAFIFNASINENNDLELYWQIAPDYYLYQDQLSAIDGQNLSLLNQNNLPPGILAKDPAGHYSDKETLYANSLLIKIPLKNIADNKMLLTYQGCAKSGFCYAPVSKLINVAPKNKLIIEDSDLVEFQKPINLLLFFGLGVLLTFTPCVLPMIPLIINLIIGTNSQSKFKAFILSSTYVTGMAISYTILGVCTGFLGATFQAWMQQPLIVGMLATILIVLALMQFGLIHFRLPHVNKMLHAWNAQQTSGTYGGAFIFGFLSAFIVSPCITPPLIGVLTFISQGGNAVIGGLSLLFLALGIGLPLILVAILSSAILPAVGKWMYTIKIIGGISLIILALWLAQGLLPIKNPESTLPWKKITNLQELKENLILAKNKQQYTLLEVYASWCASCRWLENTLFTDQEIKEKLAQFNLLRVDITQISLSEQELLNSLHIYGPPTIVIFAPDGEEINNKRVVGYVKKEQILRIK